MKVTTTINGTEIMIENDDYNEIIGFVNKISEVKQEETKTVERVNRIEKAIELNAVQFELWEYLVDNDCETGIPIAAVARHFNEGEGTVGQRLAKLAKNGYAYRVGRGRYRWSEKN